MMVSEEASTVQEDVTSTEESTQTENQEKVNSGETNQDNQVHLVVQPH